MNELTAYCVPFWGYRYVIAICKGLAAFSLPLSLFSQFARADSLRLRSGRIPIVGEGKLHFYCLYFLNGIAHKKIIVNCATSDAFCSSYGALL